MSTFPREIFIMDVSPKKSSSDDEKESTDDIELDLDYPTSRRRMEQNLRKVILCEGQFQKAKVLWRDLKVKQLARRKREVLAGCSPDLDARNAEAVEEFNHKNKLTGIARTLGLDSLERKTQASREIVSTSQEDSAIFVKEKMAESLEARIQELRSQIEHAEIVKQHLTSDPASGFKRKYPDTDYEALDEDRRSLRYPLVVYELKEKELEEDLRVMDLALLISDLKDKNS